MMPPMIQPRHLGMGHDVQVLHNTDSLMESDFGDLAFELLVSGPEDGNYTMIITHQECNAVEWSLFGFQWKPRLARNT